ncbi:MAG: signal transduction response regulator [Bacillota bacterium]|jgi:two-component system response regulator YcbB|nr:signal transduction response regulator [Bacillota bacterium]
MKIFIADDDRNIVKILEKIITDKDLGEVLGKAYNGLDAAEDIAALSPDLVLLDLLMPDKDGISLVKELKKSNPNTQYIMISQVSSKEMVSKAYESGVEFFISKPIDAIEVQTVIKKVIEKLEMNKKLEMIQSLFPVGQSTVSSEQNKDDKVAGIKRVMQRIGILSESGSQDIINAAKYLIETKKRMSDISVSELCSHFHDNPKIMEQRIRRAATVGMINLANIGIEDYMNEIFTEYSNGLYNFEQIKLEMDFIRGKSQKRGTVNLKKFIDGIVYYSEMEM